MSDWFRSYGFADVNDELLIGAYPLDAEDVRTLAAMRVQRVLNLVEEEEYEDGQREEVEAAFEAAGIDETRMRLTDYGHLPAPALEAAVQQVVTWLESDLRTYLHCRAGWQRSAAVAAGVIAVHEGIGIEAAVAQVRDRKPSANPLPHQLDDLLTWWQEREA